MNVHEEPRKRKRDADSEGKKSDAIEVDLEAPEPPSKKALRKAKKTGISKPIIRALPVENQPDDAAQRFEISTKKSSENSPEKRSPYGIWIGNLPFFVSQQDIRTFLSTKLELDSKSSDQITRISLPKGETKMGKPQNKGFAYVDFAGADIHQEAQKLSETLLGGRRILIKDSKNFEGRPKQQSIPQVPTSRRIFVGNLSFDSTSEELQSHFERCGKVSDIHMATFEDSGKCKGFAWVTFDDIMSAENAMRGFVLSRSESSPGRGRRAATLGDEEDGPRDGIGSKRRIRVNRLGDRKLRMEYAEDAATRYKKRFGSHAAQKDSGQESTHDDGAGIGLVEKAADSHVHSIGQDENRARLSKRKYVQPGYGASSVRRIQGAIVKGEGAKITFN